MSRHLTETELNSLTDSALTPDQAIEVHKHLAECPTCTSAALTQMLLKSATARAGQRYPTPTGLSERLLSTPTERPHLRTSPSSTSAWFAWATAAAVLLVSVLVGSFQYRTTQRTQSNALLSEVCDQHINALASTAPPQVISTDRHTVKPWFQGKIPFTFNLPEILPEGATLDGANLTYLEHRPVAQLLYSIGKHHVSVFVQEKETASHPMQAAEERSGFHLRSFTSADLEFTAISDVDAPRLESLTASIRNAQTPN
ncbi:anti-sigma factor [Granulicella sibirica]|uniref:Zinc-finger domain-containing protein n=1 Tax=Granulicella sibirica TaxID=2479048 RepID=A0A4Q0T1C6_9BACT|nr:anti-sigma factor [Granulicella sibirica]RXH55768.1 hypothetical protein GRAN_2625 [Granulicella sibirica]